MTLTGIGYGEMLPVNTPERALNTAWMMLSGVVWTYAIGSAAAIAATLDPNSIAYQNTMDQLNYFMRERQLSKSLRFTLRDYFQQARNVHQLNNNSELLGSMSPMLQATVATAANVKWLRRVWYLRDIGATWGERSFIAELAKKLVLRAFVANERLPVGQLYILRRGIVVKMWRFLSMGKVWGEDVRRRGPVTRALLFDLRTRAHLACKIHTASLSSRPLLHSASAHRLLCSLLTSFSFPRVLTYHTSVSCLATPRHTAHPRCL